MTRYAALDEDFRNTEVDAAHEALVSIAHTGPDGVIHYDTLRTTLTPDELQYGKIDLRSSLEGYYASLGHELVYAQLIIEHSEIVTGNHARPRLSLIKGGLAGLIMAIVGAFGVAQGTEEKMALADTEVGAFEHGDPARKKKLVMA
jgi:hypothetical protein